MRPRAYSLRSVLRASTSRTVLSKPSSTGSNWRAELPHATQTAPRAASAISSRCHAAGSLEVGSVGRAAPLLRGPEARLRARAPSEVSRHPAELASSRRRTLPSPRPALDKRTG